MLGGKALIEVQRAAAFLFDSDPKQSVGDLIRRHLGSGPRTYTGEERAVLVPVGSSYMIGVHVGLSRAQAQFAAAHELAHWYWETVASFRGLTLEARCDALAAELVATPDAVRAAVARHGHSLPELASELQTTQSVALLRLGEVCHEPVALFRENRSTIVRGPFVSWPVPLSWEPASKAPGLAKVSITDEPSKFGLIG